MAINCYYPTELGSSYCWKINMRKKVIIAVCAGLLVGVLLARHQMTGPEAEAYYARTTHADLPEGLAINITEWNFVRGGIAGLVVGGVIFFLLQTIGRRKSASSHAPGADSSSHQG